MDKKEMKFYETPAAEVVELKANVALLAGSPGSEPGDVPDEEVG
jgi:hypothetical protein